MAVIAISRELGSLGSEIGRKVAQQLGYEFVDRQTLEAVFRQYGLTKYDDLTSTMPSLRDIIDSTNLLIVSMLNEMQEALAQRGNVVILGRGSFAILNDYEDVLCVRIQAPASTRVERIMKRRGLTNKQDAADLIKNDDTIRGRFVQLFYAKQWDQESHFDLVLDTSTVSEDMAVSWIVEAAVALDAKTLPSGAAKVADIKADPVLMDAINYALDNPLPSLPDE
jgi:cytidylate kinase